MHQTNRPSLISFVFPPALARAAEVDGALQTLLFRNALVATVLVILVSGALCWLQREHVPIVQSAFWLTYMVLVSVARWILARAYYRTADREADLRWRVRFRVGLALSSFGWLATLLIFMPLHDVAAQLVTTVVLLGMAAGGIAVLSADRVAIFLHIGCTVGAAAVFGFTHTNEFAQTFSFMAVLVTIGLLRSGLYMNSALGDTLALANERARLVQELETINADLVVAKDKAFAAASAKAKFLANISHELRTPLHGVIGSVSLLTATGLSPKQRDHVSWISTSASALLAVINDVLDYSKIEAGQMSVHPTRVELRPFFASTLDIVASAAQSKQLTLSQRVAESVPREAQLDSVKLRQVLLNFLGNAIKFTSAGEVTLVVYCVGAGTPEAALQIRVEDSGIGMSEETMASIFQPFVQADDSTMRRHGGTGLGLVISKELVELLGGTVKIESVTGRGTAIEVVLPLSE